MQFDIVNIDGEANYSISGGTLRGFAKNFFLSKNPRLLWKWVGRSMSHSDFLFGKSSQNSPKPIFWSIPCVLCVNTLLKVVGYYDFSVLSMSVMDFQKSLDGL